MARKKTSSKKPNTKTVQKQNTLASLTSQVKWGESYTSLFLGAVVVIVALVLVFSFFKDRNNRLSQETSSTQTQNEQAFKNGHPTKYTVKANDDLWHIAQSVYGNGDNWVDIASVNNLTDPNTIFAGTVLTIPDTKSTSTTIDNTSTNSPPAGDRIMGSTYTIKSGDNLWDIAVRAYGDGYKWVDIARANGYTNPDLINSDNVLKLPR